MNTPPTVKSYLERHLIKQFVIGFVAMALISIAVTFFLARLKMASDLQKSALATTEAFRSQILEGDVKAAERQIHSVLNLDVEEQSLILNRDLLPIYNPAGIRATPPPSCDLWGITCFDGYTGPGRIFSPIFFDQKNANLLGFLYLSKRLRMDWTYFIIVYAIFSCGYAALILGLANIMDVSSEKLAMEVERWSLRLKNDPKDTTPLETVPFSELLPLKDALEGLNLKIASYEIQAGERAKVLVLRGIAHDLLGPVSQVQLHLATLTQQMSQTPAVENTLTEIRMSLRRVSMIASQIKGLSEVNESTELIDLASIVNDEIDTLQKSPAVSAKKIVIDFFNTHKVVLAQISKIEVLRLLQNLVSNAADASSQNSSIRIEVGLAAEQPYISVRDYGHGIPNHLLKKVFDPDYTSKSSTGTGLGLFIVKHISDERRASIHLESVVDQGTIFKLIFPILKKKANHAL